MTDVESRAQRAWRCAAVAASLHIVGMPLDLMIVRSIPGAAMWPHLCSIGAGAFLLGILAVRRHRPTVRLGNIVFLIDALVIVATFWVTNPYYAESGRPWVPFQASKLGMMTVAMLAPELWVGISSIGAYLGAATLQMATFSDVALARFALGEPWASIATGLFAAVLLVYRLKAIALEREVVRTQTERTVMRSFARTMVAIRDLANTPLQTITFASAALRLECPQAAPSLDRIDRALVTIHGIRHRIRDLAPPVIWPPADELSNAAEWLSSPNTKPT